MCERIFVKLRSFDGHTRRKEVVDQSEELLPRSSRLKCHAVVDRYEWSQG
jgi:hypothetical protein